MKRRARLSRFIDALVTVLVVFTYTVLAPWSFDITYTLYRVAFDLDISYTLYRVALRYHVHRALRHHVYRVSSRSCSRASFCLLLLCASALLTQLFVGVFLIIAVLTSVVKFTV